MNDDVVPRTHAGGPSLSWDDVVADSSVGLIDLDGWGTTALLNDRARELLQLLRCGAEGGPSAEGVVGAQLAATEAADCFDPAAPGTAAAPQSEDRVPVARGRRGPLTVRGDLTDLLWRYAPAMAETIRREGRGTDGGQPAGPAGPLAPSRVVSCASTEGRRWIRIDGYRRSGRRFLVTLVDVTRLEQENAQAAALDWELADTVAQRLVTAETALDLGRDELGRRLIAEARALIRTRIGEHVRRSGGPGPGMMRRQDGPPDGSSPSSGVGM